MLKNVFQKWSAQTPEQQAESLCRAAARGNLGRVERYLTHGLCADAPDAGGMTALYAAAKAGRTGIADYLIEAGADVNAGRPGDREGTPLLQAVIGGHEDMVALLVEAGADLSLTGYERRTPLHEAIYRGHTHIALRLLAAHADVNTEDRQGNSPLNEAINREDEDLACKLVAAGADWTAKDRFGAPAEGRARVQGMDALTAAIEHEKHRPAREAAAALSFAEEVAQAGVLQNDTAVLPALQIRRRGAAVPSVK